MNETERDEINIKRFDIVETWEKARNKESMIVSKWREKLKNTTF